MGIMIVARNMAAVLERQKLFWQAISLSHERSVLVAGHGSNPLELELSICIKLMTSFLRLSEQNLLLAILEDKPLRIATFGLFNSVVIGNNSFQEALRHVCKVQRVIDGRKEHNVELNHFEQCVVGIVQAIQEFTRTMRDFSRLGSTSVSEAHENASATLKLSKLLSGRDLKEVKGVNERFRDFDLTLCSNLETSVLYSKVYSRNTSFILQPDVLSRVVYSYKLQDMAKSLVLLRDSTSLFLDKRLEQARVWCSTFEGTAFGFGVERYIEKCVQERAMAAEFNKGLERVSLYLTKASNMLRHCELNVRISAQTITELVYKLVDSVLGYIIMASWWWLQESIGIDHVKKLRCYKKLDTPTRERFQVNQDGNQDIIAEYQRDLDFFKTMMSDTSYLHPIVGGVNSRDP